MINAAELNKGLIKKIKDQHLFPWLHKPSLYDSLFIQNMILMDTWIEYILWRYSLYVSCQNFWKYKPKYFSNETIKDKQRESFCRVRKVFWFIFPEIAIWMLFIMSLLLFESFPDPGYTTNCTMTGNSGQKCPEIEDKKSKRDRIMIS